MNPVLANVTRGNAIESVHRGAISVVDSSGRSVYSVGDINQPQYPRSSLKFIQAIPLVESGAARHYALDSQKLAFACASHNAEAVHSDLAASWLNDIGCSPDDLECGAELPLDEDTRFALIEQKQKPGRHHHNCSGKHCGLVTTARFFKEEHKGYRLYDHAVQRRLLDVVGSMASVDAMTLPWGYDGCGIPNVAMPLQSTALAFARFSRPAELETSRAEAVETIATAVAEHPYMVAGKNRLCTDLMELTGRDVLVKTGAEGFYTAVIREQGLGVALKIDDGNGRASMVALGAVLLKLDAITERQYQTLKHHVCPDVLNSRKETVGQIQPASLT